MMELNLFILTTYVYIIIAIVSYISFVITENVIIAGFLCFGGITAFYFISALIRIANLSF